MFLKVKAEYRTPSSYTEDPIWVLDKDKLDTGIRVYKYPGGIILKKVYIELNATLFQSVTLNSNKELTDVPSEIGIINHDIGQTQSENNAYSIPRKEIYQDESRGNLETVLHIKNLQIFSQIPTFYSLFQTEIEKNIIDGYPPIP